MRVRLAHVSKHYGPQTILDDVDLTVGAKARVGVVGPNGAGKSTLLRVLAGTEQPDGGTVVRTPASLTSGYLAQIRAADARATVLVTLGRRAGVADAEAELHSSASALAAGEPSAADRYAAALERFLALGGDTFEARARAVVAELGLTVELDRPASRLSGGEAARLDLASVLLSRFDVLLLDEPTNDLDFDGLERLERFLSGYDGALVLVSHDRELLDRTVSRIVEVDPATHRIHEFAGGWSDYVSRRDAERRAASARFEQAVERRRELTELLARRRTEARGRGDSLGKETGGADRRATHALHTKVRQAKRLLDRNELPEKPVEPWELRLSIDAGGRPGRVVLTLEQAVAQRGAFRLGPIDLDLVPGERLSVAGPNGSGKSTLLAMLLGVLPLESGRRVLGSRTTIATLAQDRAGYAGDTALLDRFREQTGLAAEPARTLLAKFGLGADHVLRRCASLSPGERTRAQLAELQARRVDLLVLDEPTNHLDLEAIEQLERALASYGGTLVVVSHDRRFLEAIEPTRQISLG
jgi:ATPase subunit of ABC transporter with duplicated ATPase domains